jgi:GrpB-like predicted nucleotidyltransferase (UPF0157 family)
MAGLRQAAERWTPFIALGKVMNKYELGKIYPISLTNYDNNWTMLYKKEKIILERIFGESIKIEHIGSTAIVGLVAKPTIDILIEKPKKMSNEQIINKMIENGYIHMKEQNRHLMFVKGYSSSGLEKESYHIHMGPINQDWLWDRVYFRDFLNKNPEEAIKYEKLKKDLALKYKNDREAYTEGKAKYINKITENAKKILQ